MNPLFIIIIVSGLLSPFPTSVIMITIMIDTITIYYDYYYHYLMRCYIIHMMLSTLLTI